MGNFLVNLRSTTGAIHDIAVALLGPTDQASAGP